MTTSGSTKMRSNRTVLDRLRESGITEVRALNHLQGGWVLVDGKTVTDPAHMTTPPSQVELRVIWSDGESR